MNLSKIAAISGKPGLFKVLKPARNGVIVETLDLQRKKMAISAQSKVSILSEISIYVTTGEGSRPLSEVMEAIYTHMKGEKTELVKKDDDQKFWDFMSLHVPDYDADKVYCSDVRKLNAWYNLLLEFEPEVFIAKEEEKTETSDEAVSEAKEDSQALATEAPKEETKQAKPKKAKAEEIVEENVVAEPEKKKKEPSAKVKTENEEGEKPAKAPAKKKTAKD